MPPKVRVRFAPSPTGYLHIGGARTALFNWLFARHHHGTFILRIEDTDQQRSTDEALAAIIDGLKWLGIDWDEGPGVGGEYGPYNQMARLEIYQREAKRLLASEAVYKCFCTPEELEKMREKAREQKVAPRYDGRCRSLSPTEVAEREAKGDPFVLRFRVPSGTTTFEDMVRGPITFENVEIDDLIILRSDGTPTYNFSVSVDDETMKITHVIRGEDHISNTPKQILLLRAMGVEPPEYGHVSLIMGEDGARLSKRHGATAVGAYEDLGYLPEAMFNFLALLGWSPKDNREIMTWQEMVRDFDIQNVAGTAAIFNPKKLEWMNGMYIRALSDEELAERFAPFLIKAGLMTEGGIASHREWLIKLAHATKERLHLLTDIVPYSDFFFRDIESYPEKDVKKHWSKPAVVTHLTALADILKDCEPFEAQTIEARCHEYIEREGIKLGDLVHPARLALTGKTVGPGFYETVELLGRERCLSRLRKALVHTQGHKQ
ncbi:MAG: glutamate--tRNA ligase [Candidatus Abyssobacteria bacterium SURF_17]|uniref:Glutamate--tRNA ligase n=1 Tax=Candidatus Abyssobacteria bacterium SURF_17 TaxID=2093361 RepID=A0A419F7I0_9BACT|nr:MAG: glutamate--tRNA ligase [Candidatus Abyssubacteria bacterium SURF_17]